MFLSNIIQSLRKKRILYLAVLSVFFVLIILFLLKHKDVSKNIYLSNREDIRIATISEIMNESEKYDGKIVIIKGYLYTGFEISGLYENKSKEFLNQVGICINLLPLKNMDGESVPESLHKSHGKKVLVIGRYNSNERGHMGNCYGELKDIISITIF